MEKTLGLLLCMCLLVVATNAQIGLSMKPFLGFPPTQFFQDIVLQSEAQKLLGEPTLPEDLQQRVLDTMSAAEGGFNECNTMATTLPWMQIRCVTLQLQRSKTALKAIDDEAKLRAQVALAAAAAAAAAPVNNPAVPK